VENLGTPFSTIYPLFNLNNDIGLHSSRLKPREKTCPFSWGKDTLDWWGWSRLIPIGSGYGGIAGEGGFSFEFSGQIYQPSSFLDKIS
jgi:hypothetical protein